MNRIVFRVIGNQSVGMGHVYRSLSLAHELTDCEVLFVTDSDSDKVVRTLTGGEYWTGTFPKDTLVRHIIELMPDLVVFDALNTDEETIKEIRDQEIKVLSFEDLGTGSKFTNLTINELYDEHKLEGDNYRWGNEFFFVRDEFLHAKPRKYQKHIDSILLTFGGVDQHDLSRRVYYAVRSVCKQRNISIHIVTGPGYSGYETLEDELLGIEGVTLTHATGAISGIMEESTLAITSNGRTVYELAHMNIPSIVISQHERENTHRFACEENGFIMLGLYRRGVTEKMAEHELIRLIDQQDYCCNLYSKLLVHKFSENKHRVVSELKNLL